MSVEQHEANRAWAFSALDTLSRFVSDMEIDGPIEVELASIEHRKKNLLEGKYRTLILGAFNVGKSTLINAYLGDEYLPTILEECTTKLTHVMRGNPARTVLRLSSPATEEELQALRHLHQALNILADVTQDDSRGDVVIAYPEHNPRSVNGTLKALVTMSADEDFPALGTLRAKFDESYLYLPNERLGDDIALIDSPGVHSISEQNNRIARELIPGSHLVICMLDSQTAGNEHSRDFIDGIVREHGRKVFFVINKSDYLNENEMDPTGRRGPAKDLVRSLQGAVKDPEIFFVSSLFALTADRLRQGRVTVEEVEANSKIRIPYPVLQQVHAAADPAARLAEYLRERSQFDALKRRMLQYLYTENTEGALVDAVCSFVDEVTWKYTRPLEMKLEQALQIPKLEDLKKSRERLETSLADSRRKAQSILDAYQTMTRGGAVDETSYTGYQNLVNELLGKASVEESVLAPTRAWLAAGDNFKKAKRQDFKPLTAQLEQAVAALIERAQARMNAEMAQVEDRIRAKAAELLGDRATIEKRGGVAVSGTSVMALHAGMGASYLAFGIGGTVIGAAAGGGILAALVNAGQLDLAPIVGAIAANVPLDNLQLGAVVGAAGGGLVGLILGLIARAMGSDKVRKEKLNIQIAERVEQLLLKDFHAQLSKAVEDHATSFHLKLTNVFDRIHGEIARQIRGIEEEEAALRAHQAGTIQRLEPKIKELTSLGRKAREIVQSGAAKRAQR